HLTRHVGLVALVVYDATPNEGIVQPGIDLEVLQVNQLEAATLLLHRDELVAVQEAVAEDLQRDLATADHLLPALPACGIGLALQEETITVVDVFRGRHLERLLSRDRLLDRLLSLCRAWHRPGPPC